MLLRPETPADAPAIRALVTAAFRDAPHASGTEAAIVDALRADKALALSLVAVEADRIVGHIAFSPVTIAGWFGLGPLAVQRDRRRRGVGTALVQAGLDGLAASGAGGCVVLGDPAFYGRFGFACDPALILAGVPAAYFQVLRFREAQPAGEVRYHPAFTAG
ncbi:GNAT family N-acetyltransferase [Methylobacterium aquaticum]|uniref:GNAT family N-acetyltransferase n=1 Tax=Methylobacterium aquaticum TaxID=270351 RepID=UPI001932A9DE|nr:N-acetyltransferase [Methylobacterium aquaticum]QRE73830.1 N-acetyltransferase [Methylobacterium aquaticum]